MKLTTLKRDKIPGSYNCRRCTGICYFEAIYLTLVVIMSSVSARKQVQKKKKNLLLYIRCTKCYSVLSYNIVLVAVS